jgi:hypothetical protein
MEREKNGSVLNAMAKGCVLMVNHAFNVYSAQVAFMVD